MKYLALALAVAARLASATDAIPAEFTIPDGLELDISPMSPPSADNIPMWHPPHPDVEIDGCEDDEDDKWHWVKPMIHPPKPKWPKKPMKWTTSTITATSTKTVISCGPHVPSCPGESGPKTVYTTITIPKTTTVCPVPVSTGAPAPPKTTHVVPAPGAPAPAKPTAPSAPAPAKPTLSSPAVITPKPATSVGTVTKPTPAATTSRAIVTAGAVPNAKAAGGALAAVGLAVAALM